jgi:hypothetical protein
MTTKFGPVKSTQGARGSLTVLAEVYHQGLHKHRLIRGLDAEVVKAKMLLLAAEWNEAWAKKVATKGTVRNNMDSFWNHLRWRGEIV